jgi:hypothetical protein
LEDVLLLRTKPPGNVPLLPMLVEPEELPPAPMNDLDAVTLVENKYTD